MDSGFCERIIALDDKIRFVGIVNKSGEVIAGGFQKGVEPLLEGEDEQELYLHSLSNLAVLNNFTHQLGGVCYHIAKYDKVSLMTFPLRDEILCLSTSPKADIDKIRDNILNIIENNRVHENR